MARPLVENPQDIRLAMLGMIPGNGHPYSWSAIINGRYDAAVMADCGYPAIPRYLGNQDPQALGIDGARVTHVWCDRPEDAQKVAAASYIDVVVDDARDVIGQVDAVIIATDAGGEHLERARPFIEAGLPVFIDKPLTDRADHLRQFVQWWQQGKPIMSTSSMRYAREFAALRSQLPTVGELRLIAVTMAKSWERYGIHALEAVYGLLEPGGWLDVVNSGTDDRNIVHARHASGVDVVLAVTHDLLGAFGQVTVAGTKNTVHSSFVDTFAAFKAQLEAYVAYLRSGKLPFDYAQTVEQMKVIIAGIDSRQSGGRRVALKEIEV